MQSIVNNSATDKNTSHSYVDVYESLFAPIQQSCQRILEIGVQEGGSIALWSEYFTNADVYGFDINLDKVIVDLSNPRIHTKLCDAYDSRVISTIDPMSFDVIIDDGPHTKASMITFAGMYPQLLKNGGICVIEDVQSIDWVTDIVNAFPKYMKVEVIDRRHIKGRWDDIMIVGRRVQLEDPYIVFVSAHHPIDTYFAQKTRESMLSYTNRHGYGFYYDEEIPNEIEKHQLHYRRCVSLQKASYVFPTSKWFVWVDSDVFVNRKELPIETIIDLQNPYILYHLFHEKPWSFPINTGVKIVNRDALVFESEMYKLRNTAPWNEFPYEQKNLAERVLPSIPGYYKIHDPYTLNYILYQPMTKEIYSPNDAVFIHMCTRTSEERDRIMRIVSEENRIPEENEVFY
jgi:hypothetical protein